MNYEKHYQKLVDRSPKSRPKTGYFELHHITPKCFCNDEKCIEHRKNNSREHICGLDHRSNKVFLTPEEHYLAHQLLVKMYPKNLNLSRAALLMSGGNDRSLRKSNKIYGWLKRNVSKIMKEKYASGELIHSKGMFGKTPWNKGKNDVMPKSHEHHMFGKHHKETSIQLISVNNKGKIPWNKGLSGHLSNKSLQKLSKSHIGHKDSDKTKRKKSETAKKAHAEGKIPYKSGYKHTESHNIKISQHMQGNRRGIGNRGNSGKKWKLENGKRVYYKP